MGEVGVLRTEPVPVPTCLSNCEHLPTAVVILGHEEKVGILSLYIMAAECMLTSSTSVP